MSQIIVEDEGWKRILSDPQLAKARRLLSFHELHLIVKHARDCVSDGSVPLSHEMAKALQPSPETVERIRQQDYQSLGRWKV